MINLADVMKFALAVGRFAVVVTIAAMALIGVVALVNGQTPLRLLPMFISGGITLAILWRIR